MKKDNKFVKAFLQNAALVASGSDAPYFDMIANASFALRDGALDLDQKKFYAALDSVRTVKGHSNMLDSRQSEAWSIVKMGNEYPKLIDGIVANMRKLPSLPTPTGLYDIACSIRGTGRFAKGKSLAGKGIDLEDDSEVAPTAEKMKQAMQLCNKDRNNKKYDPVTFAAVVTAMADKLARYRDGKVNKLDDAGEIMRDSEKKPVKIPANGSKLLAGIIADLGTLAKEPTLVVDNKGNGRKRRAA